MKVRRYAERFAAIMVGSLLVQLLMLALDMPAGARLAGLGAGLVSADVWPLLTRDRT